VVLRPVGDLPPSVYWVRRLLVVVALLIVVAVIWWRWPSGSDETSSTAAESSSSSSPTVTATPTESSTPEPTETKTNKNKSNKPECDDKDIEVTVATDAEVYPPEELPEITFTVENVSNSTCSRDVGQAANELQVTSGGSQVWSSDDCSPGGDEDLDNLKPGERFVQTVTWARTESAEGCPTPQEAVSAGAYQVIARNLDLISEPAAFELE
jgi:hypothetical protein